MRFPTIVVTFFVALGMAHASGAEKIKIDLRTPEGVNKVKGEWRYHEVKIVEVTGKGPDGKPNKTYDIEPHAEKPTFDDSQWEVLDPKTLGQRRSTGQVCFNWYRIKVTLPEEADLKTVHFVTTADDYGEIWVDGNLPRKVGDSGGHVIAGFNVPNRVELKGAKAGKVYQIAVFGINGPISAAPGNYIFLKDTFLEIEDKK
jgi:gluconolactonase